jgi:hypothetical protein
VGQLARTICQYNVDEVLRSAHTISQYNVDEVEQSAHTTCQYNVDEVVQSAHTTCQCSVPLCPLYSPEKNSYSVFTNRSDLLSVRNRETDGLIIRCISSLCTAAFMLWLTHVTP